MEKPAHLCASKAGVVNNMNDGFAWGLYSAGIAPVGRAGLPTTPEADDRHWNGSFQPAPFPEYPRNEK